MIAQEKTRYTIDLPQFSGPLDLLLNLIEENELDITSLSLIAITDQYLAQIEQMKSGKIDHLIDFIVVGARLLLIKSRALLPQSELDSQAEDEEEPAEALARQLREYRRFKNSAAWLDHRWHSGLRSYLRVAPAPVIDTKLDLEGIGLDSLTNAIQEALSRTQLKEESISIATEGRAFTISNQINKLRNLITRNGRTSFRELLSRSVTFQEVSVSLLAVLELIKRHEVLVFQEELFGPIEIVSYHSSSDGQATETSL